MRQHSEVHITSRLTAGALDFQPWITTVDGLVDRGRGIYWLAVCPHAFIPARAQKAVGLLDECFTFRASRRGLRCQNSGHRARLAKLLAKSLAVTAGQRRRVVLRSHSRECSSNRPKGRPAAVLLVAPCSVLASVVQQSLRDLLPSSLLPVEVDRVHLLNLDNALAPAARNPQDMLPEVAQPERRAPSRRLVVSGAIVEN